MIVLNLNKKIAQFAGLFLCLKFKYGTPIRQGFDTVRAASTRGISEAILWTPVRDGKLNLAAQGVLALSGRLASKAASSLTKALISPPIGKWLTPKRCAATMLL